MSAKGPCDCWSDSRFTGSTLIFNMQGEYPRLVSCTVWYSSAKNKFAHQILDVHKQPQFSNRWPNSACKHSSVMTERVLTGIPWDWWDWCQHNTLIAFTWIYLVDLFHGERPLHSAITVTAPRLIRRTVCRWTCLCHRRRPRPLLTSETFYVKPHLFLVSPPRR